MYSYADRIRAVELYIKLEKCVRPTIRQLGYPTKKALKGWYRGYVKRLDLPEGHAGREPNRSTFLSSYEDMNDLLVVQVFVHIPKTPFAKSSMENVRQMACLEWRACQGTGHQTHRSSWQKEYLGPNRNTQTKEIFGHTI